MASAAILVSAGAAAGGNAAAAVQVAPRDCGPTGCAGPEELKLVARKGGKGGGSSGESAGNLGPRVTSLLYGAAGITLVALYV